MIMCVNMHIHSMYDHVYIHAFHALMYQIAVETCSETCWNPIKNCEKVWTRGFLYVFALWHVMFCSELVRMPSHGPRTSARPWLKTWHIQHIHIIYCTRFYKCIPSLCWWRWWWWWWWWWWVMDHEGGTVEVALESLRIRLRLLSRPSNRAAEAWTVSRSGASCNLGAARLADCRLLRALQIDFQTSQKGSYPRDMLWISVGLQRSGTWPKSSRTHARSMISARSCRVGPRDNVEICGTVHERRVSTCIKS